MTRALAFLALAGLVACGDRGATAGGGTIILGAAADADALLPGIVRSVQGRIGSELLFDRIAEMGPSLETAGDRAFEPMLARSWDWSADSLTLTLHFDPAARWHDGRPVRSSDYSFALRVVREPNLASSIAADVAGIDSITTPDSVTAVVHYATRDAEQFYAASLLVPIPEHIYGSVALADLRTSPEARAPVGNGRFRFVAWEPDVRIELRAVEDHYRGRAKPDRIILAKSADPASGLARVWAEETDVWDPLLADVLPEAARYPHVRVYSGPGFDYGFAAFNFRANGNVSRPHPLLADARMRRALSLGTDRAALVRTVFDSTASVLLGPFLRAQATADTTLRQIPHDRAAAQALLDSLGWLPSPDGIRRRNGVPLRVSLLVPTSSAPRNRAAAVLQQQWKEIGVDAQIESLEFQTFLDRMAAGRFDIALQSFRSTPSPRGIRSVWGSPAIAGPSRQNAGRYASPAFDEAVMDGLGALDPAARRAAFRRAYQQAIDDAAAIWLFESRSNVAVHRRFTPPLWRSDAWWLTLSEWTLDPAARLPRDAAPSP
ncbi:MAG: hypothetical protein KF709_09535 [Gemmatimonadaceae bacterium]|nr:hypothetical protein [Gemmatimonadaceae bacterium]